MTMLALDLGTKTGFAMRLPDGKVHSGVVKFKPSAFEGAGMRYLRFNEQLLKWNAAHGIKFVAFEEVRAHTGTTAAHVYGGFMTTLTEWCERHNIPYVGVPVGTIKKSATGNGSAGKQAMIRAANALGYATADDNEADAIHILHYCIARWLPVLEDSNLSTTSTTGDDWWT